MSLGDSIRALLGRGGRKDAGREGAAVEAESVAERRDMIRGVEELSETTVKEIMIPRVDAVFLPIDVAREELLETVVECGHSRIPIYRETIDRVEGVLYVKDLLKSVIRGDDPIDLEAVIRKPFFVPDSKRIDSLLREFRRRHVHIAIAIDEYGGVSGLICLEDIIEEIVGDIQDEFDDEREDVVAIGDGIWIVDGRLNLADLNEELGLGLPDDEFDTLGGFVFDLFGKIPARYEKAAWRGLDFIIQDMDGHKVDSVKIVRRRAEGAS